MKPDVNVAEVASPVVCWKTPPVTLQFVPVQLPAPEKSLSTVLVISCEPPVFWARKPVDVGAESVRAICNLAVGVVVPIPTYPELVSVSPAVYALAPDL